VVFRPSVWVADTVAAVESDSTNHREAKECAWIEHPSTGENRVPSVATVQQEVLLGIRRRTGSRA